MDAEVIIVGGGPVGLVMAGLLASRNITCILLDAAEEINDTMPAHPDSRALAISPASRNILAAIDLWSRLPGDRVGCFRHMHVWDENGQGEIFFNGEDINQPALGYIVEQRLLQTTIEPILACLPALEIHHGQAVSALVPEKNSLGVRTADRIFSARLVIAADGAASLTRDLAGIVTRRNDYRQTALACVARFADGHGEVARQRFLTDGPLALLPMAGPEQCGIVWSTSTQYAELLHAMNLENFHRALGQRSEHCLGEALESGPRTLFPLQRIEAEDYCRERFVLIGDAAHNIHPLAGMGANLGMLDAACLAQVLNAAREKNKDLGGLHILRRYERWRRLENRIMSMVMEGFKYLFEEQTPPLPMVRNAGLDITDSIAPLKHWLMRQAMGLSGDLPEAARQNGGVKNKVSIKE